MDDLKEALKSIDQLANQIKSLEDHVISSSSDSNVKLDVVLKELVAYLNITAQNLKDVNTNIIELIAYKDMIKPIPGKIDNVENRIFEITKTLINETNNTRQNLSKMSEYISHVFLKILSNDKDQSKKIDDAKYIIEGFNKSIEESKETIKKTQDSLFDFMNKLLDSKSDLETSKISARSKSETDEVELKKVRSKIWIKVISALIGSGGLIYFFIDIVGNLAGK